MSYDRRPRQRGRQLHMPRQHSRGLFFCLVRRLPRHIDDDERRGAPVATNSISHAIKNAIACNKCDKCNTACDKCNKYCAQVMKVLQSCGGGGGGGGRDAKGTMQGGAHNGAEEEGEHVTRMEMVRQRQRMRALALFLTIALFVAITITLAALDRRRPRWRGRRSRV